MSERYLKVAQRGRREKFPYQSWLKRSEVNKFKKIKIVNVTKLKRNPLKSQRTIPKKKLI